MAVYRPNLYMQLSFSGVDDAEFVTVNTVHSLHPSLSHFHFGTCLHYQPYRYADCAVCDVMQYVDPVNNHYNYIFPNCKYYSNHDFTTSVRNHTRAGLSLIHFNARSLSSNFKLIADYLTGLRYKFDIIAISKTWLNMHTQDDYELE